MFSKGDYFFAARTYEERTLTLNFNYGCSWQDDRLLLYYTFYSEEEVVLHRAPEPFAVLTPIDDQ